MLFVDVDNSMTIAQGEIFGPVLAVMPFDDEDDAIRIANDSVYGLAGNVISGSLETLTDKQTGVGRQNGAAGFDQYTETESVAYPAG